MIFSKNRYYICPIMQYAVCQVSIAPLRAHPNDKSEMMSQLLFGETVEWTDSKDNWRLVTCAWDGVTGWIDAKQIKAITVSEYVDYRDSHALSLSLVEGLMATDHFVPLTLGAVLPRYDGLRCELGEQSFQFSGPVVTPAQAPQTGDWIAKIARRYLHAPYLYGGRSPFGIDAAGLIQMVFKIAGVKMPRTAGDQVNHGRVIDFTEQCQLGDIAFFDNEKGDINHVGIILPDCHVIHASGRVRVDKLDHFGIFNRENNRYSHQLRIVKRLLPDAVEAEHISIENFENQLDDNLVSQAALF
jgi:gamma-D-glutamyl-L-lysine dipeptidyl-peptidase